MKRVVSSLFLFDKGLAKEDDNFLFLEPDAPFVRIPMKFVRNYWPTCSGLRKQFLIIKKMWIVFSP